MTNHTDSHDNNSRQPDIEVYIKDSSIDEIISWLKATFEAITLPSKLDTASINVICKHQNTDIPLTIYTGAAGKLYTSLWFQSAHTPWVSDLDCATALAESLDKEVRCATNSWEESQDADNEWWKVTKDNKTKVNW